ncbi:MAG: radical SAM protein, partial [Candidatus Acetothermia bacterium]
MKDRHGRTVDYLRVSITDRCNYRCKYCMPEEGVNTGSKEDILSLEGIVKLVRASNNLGIHKVRLTGGEPLVRRGIEKLISMLNRTCSVEDLSLTTNGSLLKEKAQALARSG